MPPYVKIVLDQRISAQPHHHPPDAHRRACTSGRSARAPRPSASRRSSWTCFQMRRCQEDLAPSPAHPGCIYGEMGMCLRPCQQVVGPAEYAHEVARVVEFLRTDGRSLLESHRALARPAERGDAVRGRGAPAQALRESAGGAEAARRTGARCRPAERRGDHARRWRPTRWRCGSCATARGAAPQRFSFEVQEGKPVSLDHKLRETFAAVAPAQTDRARAAGVSGAAGALVLLHLARRRMAAVSRATSDIPYRKLVNAVSRVARRDSAI